MIPEGRRCTGTRTRRGTTARSLTWPLDGEYGPPRGGHLAVVIRRPSAAGCTQCPGGRLVRRRRAVRAQCHLHAEGPLDRLGRVRTGRGVAGACRHEAAGERLLARQVHGGFDPRPEVVRLADQRGRSVQMGHGERVRAAAHLQGVAQGDRVEVADTERALPAAAPVVRLRAVEQRVLGDERAGSVPRRGTPAARPAAARPCPPRRAASRRSRTSSSTTSCTGGSRTTRPAAPPARPRRRPAPAQQPGQEALTGDPHPLGEGGERRRAGVDRRGVQRAQLVAAAGRAAASAAGAAARGSRSRRPGERRRGGQRVRGGLADAHAARAVPAPPVVRARLAARWYGVVSSASRSTVSRSSASGDAEGGQVVRLGDQRERVDHHEPGQVRYDSGRERARAELGERVVPSVAR